MTKKINIAHALHSLTPGAIWKYNDEDYSTIEWFSEDIEMPSQESVFEEIERLTKAYEDEQLLLAQEEKSKEAAKLSALQKLSKFGLTEEEAKAIVGL